ncbi:MAG TPA: pyridoxal kinase PdxY [Methylomirabilota bacterium]|nr:pyridoxal kinase PdxY [Methylomirabilota bacterium]
MNVLSIQSTVSYGRVGHRAALLPLERLGHDVWPIDTVAFSNHPAHGSVRGRIVPATEVADLLAGLIARGVVARCDAVLSGYLGDAATGAVVRDAVAAARAANPAALYCCDPVIGEVGRGSYVRPGIAECFRETLAPIADLLTPNPYELERLAGRAPATVPAALEAADALRARGTRLVVVTGLRVPEAPGHQLVLGVSGAGAWAVRVPERRVRVHGTGDAFTALLLAAYLPARDAPAALAHAAAGLDAVLALAESSDADELPLVAAQDALVHPPIPRVPERVR